MIRINFLLGISVCLAALGMAKIGSGEVIDFEDLILTTNSHWCGSTSTTYFTSGTSGTKFNNSYTDYGSYSSWYGFAYSNVCDVTTAGYTNQYAVYNSTGTGYGGSGNYAVVCGSCSGSYASSIATASMTLAAGTRLASAYFCNTTYAALSMIDGDGWTSPFSEGSYLYLTITAKDSAGNTTGSTGFYLARYTDAGLQLMDAWTYEDLSALGDGTNIVFTITSSDNGAYSINTPAYFAIDDLTVVPEPATLALLAAAAMGFVAFIRRRK